MSDGMSWRELINRYFIACQEDHLEAARAETNVRRMFMAFGSTNIRLSIDAQRPNAERLSRLPLNPVESYIVVQETTNLVVAEVDTNPGGHPPLPTRFRVVRTGNMWLLDGIYWKCHCEDGKCLLCEDGSCWQCSKGKCSFCDGTGSSRKCFIFTRPCVLCDGSGSCFYCKGQGICNHCEGVGKCKSCSHSDMPGWTNLYPKPQDAQLAPGDTRLT